MCTVNSTSPTVIIVTKRWRKIRNRISLLKKRVSGIYEYFNELPIKLKKLVNSAYCFHTSINHGFAVEVVDIALTGIPDLSQMNYNLLGYLLVAKEWGTFALVCCFAVSIPIRSGLPRQAAYRIQVQCNSMLVIIIYRYSDSSSYYF